MTYHTAHRSRKRRESKISPMKSSVRDSVRNSAYKEQKNLIPIPVSDPSKSIKISVRLKQGIVTSLTLKKSIIALWIIFREQTKDNQEVLDDVILDVMEMPEKEIHEVEEGLRDAVIDFVHECLEEWDKGTGKGLSDFITERMIKSFLDNKEEVSDYSLFVRLNELLK